MIFDKENWLWKSNLGTFWNLPNLKISNLYLGMLIFRQKYFQFCTPHLKTQQPVLPYLQYITLRHNCTLYTIGLVY